MSNYVGYARQVYLIYSRFYIHLFYLYTCIYSNSVFRRCVVDDHTSLANLRALLDEVMMKFMFNVAAMTWMMSDSRIWA